MSEIISYHCLTVASLGVLVALLSIYFLSTEKLTSFKCWKIYANLYE